MFSLKRHIALLSVFVLLLPSVIQIAHTFEEHEHVVCTATDEHHFHENDVDCSELHYQFEVFSQNFTNDFTTFSATLFKTNYSIKPQLTSVYISNNALPRAPPTLSL